VTVGRLDDAHCARYVTALMATMATVATEGLDVETVVEMPQDSHVGRVRSQLASRAMSGGFDVAKPGNLGKAAREAAQVAGSSERSTERAAFVRKQSPAAFDLVRAAVAALAVDKFAPKAKTRKSGSPHESVGA